MDYMFLALLLVANLIVLIYLSIPVFTLISMYKTAPPGQVLVVAGFFCEKLKIFRGTGTIVLPKIQKVVCISLQSTRIQCLVDKVLPNLQNRKISIDLTGQVKVCEDEEKLLLACENFSWLCEDSSKYDFDEYIGNIACDTIRSQICIILDKLESIEDLQSREIIVNRIQARCNEELEKLGLCLTIVSLLDLRVQNSESEILQIERTDKEHILMEKTE